MSVDELEAQRQAEAHNAAVAEYRAARKAQLAALPRCSECERRATVRTSAGVLFCGRCLTKRRKAAAAARQERGPCPGIVRTPTGRFVVVGAVPLECLEISTPPTRSQVVGGRCFTRDGVSCGWDGKGYETEAEAVADLKRAGVAQYQAVGGGVVEIPSSARQSA